MKKLLLFTVLAAFTDSHLNAQCYYIPATSSSIDSLSYSFSGGSFASFGCAPIDPTFWIAGGGVSVTVTFVNPQSYPSFRVWGMNTDDFGNVTVNGVPYPLTASSAAYDAKVVCGLSPGPDGVVFSGGDLVGANTPAVGNYSYQNVQLNATNVTTITVTGIAGAGWGFAGSSVNCPSFTGITNVSPGNRQMLVYPNPFTVSAIIQLNPTAINAELCIYNQSGQKVKTIAGVSGNEVIIDRENLQSGLYYFRVTQNAKDIAAGKFVIID